MRIKTSLFVISLLLGMLISCEQSLEKSFPQSFDLTISNTLNEDRNGVMVHISREQINELAADFNPNAFVVVDQEGNEIASQFNETGLSTLGIVLVVAEMKASAKQKLTVRYHPEGENERLYKKRTQAELSHKIGGEWDGREYKGGDFVNIEYLHVPPQHKDHSWYLRYEGPGWESEKVGYRFYLDQRNAVDVFGKKVEEPILQMVGLDGFDSYHEMQDWGMDVFKVAKSLGVGSLAIWANDKAERVEFTDSVTCEVTQNGAVYSSVLTNYYGWKTAMDTLDIASEISIHAGTRLSRQKLQLSKDLENFCTGLIKDKKAAVFMENGTENAWGYLATYGKQSLNDDLLGIAVLFSPEDFVGFDEDQFSHVVKLKSDNQQITYYFLAAWEGELNGIKSEEAFLTYLQKTANELAHPININTK